MKRWFGLLALLLASPAAHAVFGEPIFVPARPAVGEPVTMTIRADGCDLYAFNRPGRPSVERLGNRITVVVAATPTEWCISPLPAPTRYPISLGTLPAGVYLVELIREDYDGLTPLGQVSVITVPLTVGGPPFPIPMSPTSLALIAGLVLVTAAASLKSNVADQD
jgi:hypothetical protein